MRISLQRAIAGFGRPLALIMIAVAIVAVALTSPSPAPANPTDGAAEPVARPPVPPSGGHEVFLKLDGIEGESISAGHQGELDILSWSWGLTIDTPDNPTRPVVGRPKFTDLTFSADTSKASPQLMLACAQGKHLKSAVVAVRRANAAGENEAAYLTITLNEVMVSSFQQSSAAGSDVPSEQFTLTFGQIIMEYRAQRADGSYAEPVRTGWDLTRNRPL